jgi:hypothetical protein
MHLIGLLKVAGLAAMFAISTGAPETHDSDWVKKRLQDWQPTAKDRSWENIGWARSLSEALKLGKENGRPIFLFTHDGHLNVGRC